MNQIRLTELAHQAAIMGRMLSNWPDPENRKVTFPPSPYYRFFYLLAMETRPALSVELGLCGGGGSLHLAMAGGRVIGVDLTIAEYEDNIRWIKRHYPGFQYFQGDSRLVSSNIYAAFGEIDFLFIDTTHTYEQTMAEYRAYQPFLSDRAIVCLDDLYRDGMERAWDELPGNKMRFDFLHPQQSPTDGGFGVIWR